MAAKATRRAVDPRRIMPVSPPPNPDHHADGEQRGNQPVEQELPTLAPERNRRVHRLRADAADFHGVLVDRQAQTAVLVHTLRTRIR